MPFWAFFMNFCLLNIQMQLASLAMLNATFLKIFKHYELSETSGKLTCLHKTFRHFRKGNSKLYCMSQPNITCADFELFKKDFFNMCVTKV